ncbi:MAG: site-specific integrase [Candidatus Aenigmarchaeota archaeon]|nr:site-specific integrase [Candidatus Aenigmarchaeota archaeon]
MIDIRKQIYGEREVVARYEKAIQNSAISDRNKQMIMDFKDFCSALGNSPHRIAIVIRHMMMLADCMDVDFDKAERKDVEKAIARLNSTDYADWTKVTAKKITKRFYRWLNKCEDTDPLPNCVRWIRCKNPPNTLKKEDLITKEDVEQMIRSTPQLMYKAMLSVLYEGAMRPGELLQMTIKDVRFEENYITVYVRGKMQKTMGDRKIYLIQSYDLLHRWLENHPFRDNPEHPVWIVSTNQVYKKRELYGKAISIEFLNAVIKKCSKRAGIKKRTYAYLFRHSRGTQLYIDIGESMAKKIMGHAPDSAMSKVYNHLNEEDVLQKLKEMNGIADTKKKEEKSEVCGRCGHPNQFGGTICSRCGLVLNTKAALISEADKKAQEEQMQMMKQLLDTLQKNPNVMNIIQSPGFIDQQAEIRAKEMFKEWKRKNSKEQQSF